MANTAFLWLFLVGVVFVRGQDTAGEGYRTGNFEDNEIGNGHPWIMGEKIWPWVYQCDKYRRRECSIFDLTRLKEERRNVCNYGYLWGRHPVLNWSFSWNVNADTLGADCGRMGTINHKLVSSEKSWCCKTNDPKQTPRSYTRGEIDKGVCGERVERDILRFDHSIYTVYYQQRICDRRDLLVEYADIGRNCVPGWAMKEGVLKVMRCYPARNIYYHGEVIDLSDGNYPVYCCNRDYKRPGERCTRDSDCGSWICNGVCQLAYSTQGTDPLAKIGKLVSVLKLYLLMFCFTALACVVCKAISPAFGYCCCSCRCKRKTRA